MTHAHDSRVFGLDLLRAVAVLFVVYGHGYPFLRDYVSQEVYRAFEFDGVNLFFVLSGFLIGRILLRMVAREDFGAAALLEFWVRRWFRTIPNYLAVLSFLVLAALLFDWTPRLPPDLLPYFVFSQNIAWRHPSFFPEAWSLAVEEWFYLATPLLLYLSSKIPGVGRHRLVVFWIGAVILAVTAFRLWRAAEGDFVSDRIWGLELRRQVLTRMDSLMFGVLGAYLSLFHGARWLRFAPQALLLGICLLVFDKVYETVATDHAYRNYFTLTIGPLATLLLLPALSSWKTCPGPLARAVTFVSLVSYSMYLLNLSVVNLIVFPPLERALGRVCLPCSENGLLLYALYWTLTITASWLLYRYFERPTTALRDRWRLRRCAPVSAFARQDAEAGAPTAEGRGSSWRPRSLA